MAITEVGSAASATYNGVSSSGAKTLAIGGASQSNAMLVMGIIYTTTSTTPQPITSITDNQGNTWSKYTAVEAHSGWSTGPTVNGAQKSFAVEVWYTKGATVPATSIDITVNHSGTIDAAAMVISPKLLGYDAANPFDGNASLPKIVQASTSTAETITGISTTQTHIYPIWIFGTWGTTRATQNVSFNGVSRNQQVIQQKNASEFIDAEYASGIGSGGPAVTGPYSNVTYSAPTSCTNWYAIGFALTSDASSPSGTLAATETADTAHMVGYLFSGVRGDLTATENPDTLAAAGHVAASGVIFSVEAVDTFSAFGFQPITGTFVTTGAADQFHATGIGLGEDGVLITVGTPDIFSAVGAVPPQGTLAATGAADRARFIGAGVTQVRRRRRRFVT